MAVYLVDMKAYAILLAGNRFIGSETPKYNAFDFIDENFENLNLYLFKKKLV